MPRVKRAFPVILFLTSLLAGGGSAQSQHPPLVRNPQIDSLNKLAHGYIRTNPDSALLVVELSLAKAREAKYVYGEAFALFLLGNFHQNRGQLDLAYRNFYEALRLSEIVGVPKCVADCYNSIGDVFRRQKNFNEANRNYQLSYDLAISIKDSSLISENVNNFGDVYRDQRDYEKAIDNYKKALALDIRMDDKYGITDGYNNLGDVYLYLKRYEEAISNYNQALTLADSMNNQLELADNLNKLGRVYLAMGDFNSSLQYLNRAAAIGSKIKMAEEQMETYDNLAQVYQQIGQHDKALDSYQLYIQFRDSLVNVKSVRQISELQFLHESEKKDSEIRLKEAELQARSMQLKWLLTAVILLTILALVFYKNHVTRQRVSNQLLTQQTKIALQKESLEEKNRQMQVLDKQKNEILGIVAHDLRTPVNQAIAVVHLMRYEKTGYSNDMVSYLNILERSVMRMKFMVSEILDFEAIENSKFNLEMKPVNLANVVEEEKNSYQIYANKKNIRIDTQILDKATYAILDENFFRSILENLLSNAVKYSPEGTIIRITMKCDHDRVITSVKDEGPGLNENDMKLLFGKYQRLSARPTGGEESLGLGLSLVKKFTDAMNGEVWCESTLGHGAEFFVAFKQYHLQTL